jgi:hypothetical protein
MKATLWTLGATLVLAVLALTAVVVASPAPAPEASRAIVDPFKQPTKPAIVDPFKPQAPAVAEGCPAGFVDQGGVCTAESDVAYQADTKRRQDNAELAEAVADELRGD